jgi:hypothetical protein
MVMPSSYGAVAPRYPIRRHRGESRAGIPADYDQHMAKKSRKKKARKKSAANHGKRPNS